jgi:phage regulator Rha-like protein
MSRTKEIVPVERIANQILLIRSQKVILDTDLAELYGVPTKVLNQAIKRNIDRFPEDFMFQLNQKEFNNLRSQIVTSKYRGGRRYLPYVFTEHGAIMVASVLNSPKAVEVSILVVRAFVKLREILSTHKELALKLDQLERKIAIHDDTIQSLITAIRELMEPPEPRKRAIGFHAKHEEANK